MVKEEITKKILKYHLSKIYDTHIKFLAYS